MALLLNGFRVRLSATQLVANVRDVPDPAQMKSLRTVFGSDWFLSWRAGKAFGIPRGETPSRDFGQPQVLACDDHDHLHLITSRLNDVLPQRFPRYKAFSRRPFAFLGIKEEV